MAAWCAISFDGYYANPLYYGSLYCCGETITELVIPEDVTAIGKYTFCCKGLTGVTVHPGVTSIGTGAFYAPA